MKKSKKAVLNPKMTFLDVYHSRLICAVTRVHLSTDELAELREELKTQGHSDALCTWTDEAFSTDDIHSEECKSIDDLTTGAEQKDFP